MFTKKTHVNFLENIYPLTSYCSGYAISLSVLQELMFAELGDMRHSKKFYQPLHASSCKHVEVRYKLYVGRKEETFGKQKDDKWKRVKFNENNVDKNNIA